MASLTDRSFWPKIWDATPPSPADISCATCHGYWRVKGTLLSRFIYLIRLYLIWVSYPTLTYHFQDAYFQFREACPLLRELGYRKFCQHEAWERMKGCNSSVVKYIHKVCTKKPMMKALQKILNVINFSFHPPHLHSCGRQLPAQGIGNKIVQKLQWWLHESCQVFESSKRAFKIENYWADIPSLTQNKSMHGDLFRGTQYLVIHNYLF